RIRETVGERQTILENGGRGVVAGEGCAVHGNGRYVPAHWIAHLPTAGSIHVGQLTGPKCVARLRVCSHRPKSATNDHRAEHNPSGHDRSGKRTRHCPHTRTHYGRSLAPHCGLLWDPRLG